jgi:hypothetical protein
MLETFVENVGACFQNNYFQVNKMFSKLITTGSLLYEKPDRKETVLTERKLDAIRDSLETSPIHLSNDYITRHVFLKCLHEETQNYDNCDRTR